MLKSKPTEEVQKLVIDTNVLVSSLLGKSYPHKIVFDLVFANRITLFVSPPILQEYEGVLSRKKFQRNPTFQSDAQNLLESIADIGIQAVPKIFFNILPDKSDNKFLELAVASEVDCLITGNKKHFPFSQFENTLILSPKEYWDTYWK